MSQSYPPDPPNGRSNPRLDEIIAIIVALATMGTILFWTLSHPNRKLTLTPDQTPPQTQTSSENQTLSKILEDSLPDGVSAPSGTTSQPPTTATTPAPTVNQPWWIALGLVPQTAPDTSIATSPQPQVTPVPPETTNINPTETACPTQPNGGNICSTTPPPVTTKSTPQTAKSSLIPEGYWASPFVVYFINKNWATGSDQKPLKPDEKITRGEFAAQLEKAFNKQPEQPPIKFKDVPQNFWAKPALKEVTQSGFLVGYPGDIFRPKQEIPRVQVLVALASGLELKPPTNPQQTLKIFTDANQIPPWAIEGVAAATEAGLVVNYPDKNTLNPNQTATYGEVSSMIYQGLVYRGKAQPIASDYIVNSP
ncbi:conserved hypothetical protein [Planktothrix serta PCC 8927]|uniref:SLH domain-containing protein n=1 Tax=Planktothrix serta PCC 8927 TaxID=671068 RepID=A0A7Z9DZS6_9CYAN|nr:S-layer homology domain-containing protein [Planktothrix serta]VXD20346.1 conserved hypothetical protein [Planktothrix serta PCC 8927]